MPSPRWRRLGTGALVLTVLATVVVVAGGSRPAAAEFDPASHGSWGVSGVDEFTTQNYDAEVWDLQQIGEIMYVGGKFLEVRASYNGPAYPQRYLAAFDVHTGEWLDWFVPAFDGPVYELDVTADGRLVVGGEFTRVNGSAAASGLAVLDPSTGEIDPTWRATVERRFSENRPVIRDMVVHGSWLYFTGNFSHVTGPDGRVRQFAKVARVALATGQPDATWTPQLNGSSGWGIAVSADSQRVHLAGQFTSVAAQPGTSLLATVDATTGALVDGWQHGPRDFWIFQDLVVAGDLLYATGAEHAFYILDSRTGELVQRVATPHDTQVAELIGDRVYIGCHCESNGRWLYAVDAATGQIITDFLLDASAAEGGWAVHQANDGCLWIGGDFRSSRVAGKDGRHWVGGFLRVCQPGGPPGGTSPDPPPVTDTTAPTTPTNLAASYVIGPSAQLSWTASTDDQAVRTYLVWRDGVVIGASQTTTYVDRTIPRNGTYTYQVSALDGAWNASPVSGAAVVGVSSVRTGTASQSSTRDGQSAERAIDGNLNGVGSQGSVSLTQRQPEPYPWWQIDLGQSTQITGIRLWGGTSYSYRTKDIWVMVSDTPFESNDVNVARVAPGVTSTFLPGPLVRGVPVAVNRTGRYVRIQASSQRHVQLAEVQVEGVPSGAPPPPPPADTTAPTTPGALTGVLSGGASTEVRLSWTPATDDRAVTHYAVVRDGVEAGITARSSFVDRPPEQGQIRYEVVAVDGAGNRSLPAVTTVTVTPPQTELVAFGSSWRYLVGDPPAGWRQPGFDDSGWATGAAPLGFGNGDETTVLPDGHVVTELRQSFEVGDAAAVGDLVVDLVRDDGAVVYLNGTEIARSNVTGSSYASSSLVGADETAVQTIVVADPPVVQGANVLAVTLHQGGARTGGDLRFDLRLAHLAATPDVTPPPVPAGLATTDVTASSVGLRWDPVEDDRSAVRYVVRRDGQEIGEVTTSAYRDGTVVALARYEYSVEALDVAGNASGPSAVVAVTVPAATASLVAANATWRYLATGVDPGPAWATLGFDDGAWPAGAAELGAGDGDETTVVPVPAGAAVLFRHRFTVADAAAVASLALSVRRDDGVVLYLNGTEIGRDNLPDGPVALSTRAAVAIFGADERAELVFTVPPGLLVDGENILAASLHNVSNASVDLTFAASLTATLGAQPVNPATPAGLAAPTLTARRVELRWDAAAGATSYRVLRDGTSLGEVASTTFTDSTVEPERTYSYAVVALGVGGLASDPSAPLDVTTPREPGTIELLSPTATWRWSAPAAAPAPDWMQAGFDDGTWASGVGEFGFGDGDEQTVTTTGRLTTYFRTTFTVDDPAALSDIVLLLVRDDGAAVYLNGTEITRTNLPAGPLTADTFATAAAFGPSEREPLAITIAPAALRAGTNVLAVEVHNESRNGGDLSLAAWITATA
jgi:hypothetical protein